MMTLSIPLQKFYVKVDDNTFIKCSNEYQATAVFEEYYSKNCHSKECWVRLWEANVWDEDDYRTMYRGRNCTTLDAPHYLRAH